MVRSNELAARRKIKGETQEDCAKIIGCSVTTYCNKENNKAMFTIEDVKLLSDYLDIVLPEDKVYIFLA